MAEKLIQLCEKLNNKNYIHWNFKMKMILKKEDCWDPIETEKPTSENEKKVWEKQDNKAYCFISLCVENNQLTHIKNLTTSKDAWEALKKYHQKSTLSSKIRLKKKLYKAEMKKDDDMEAHLNKLSEWMDELEELGEALDDKNKVAVILTSLNDDYDTLITALDARDEEKLSFGEVKAKLLDEADRRKQKNSKELSTALKVTKFNSKKRNYANVKCYTCNKMGHISKDCFKRMDSKKENSHASNLASNGSAHAAFHARSNEIIDGWCIDSGSTCHISNNSDHFITIDMNVQEEIVVANGEKLSAIGKGNVNIVTKTDANEKINVTIYDVLYVPKAKGNLLSVHKLVEKNLNVTFSDNKCRITKGRQEYAVGKLTNGLYILQEFVTHKANFAKQSDKLCIHDWHRRLAHRNLDDIKKMTSYGLKINVCKCNDDCEACIMGKMQRKSFPKRSLSPAREMLDVIVTDVCGKMPKSSIAGKDYFVTFIDEFTRYSYVYFLKEKSEVPDVLIRFVEMIKTRFGKKPKIIRSDRGGEYVNGKVQTYLQQQGIQIQYTVAYSPQQNGIAERRNRTLMEAARTMMFAAKFDSCYWAEAVACANHVQNRLITSSTNKTPYEMWYGEKSLMNDFHEFGSDVYAWIPGERRKKLDKKARKLKFVGYDESSKGYRLTNKDTKDVIIARDVKFLTSDSDITEVESTDATKESIVDSIDCIMDTYDCKSDDNDDIPIINGHEYNNAINEQQYDNNITGHDDSIISEYHDTESSYYETDISYPEIEQDNDEEYIDTTIVPNPNEVLRRSNRQNSGQNSKYSDYACNKVISNLNDKDPTSYKEAMSRSDKELWQQAMNEEMESIHKNNTWTLVDLPKNRKAIGSKWVYKVKRDVNGNVLRHKARLVAQGYNQKYGTDYDEVFAPVVRQTTFRMLLSVAAKRGYKVKHYDIKTAFLNGELEEDIYMRQPPGFEKNNKVCHLLKGLYGLKQAARSWNKAIHSVLTSNGYKQSMYDKCLYMKTTNGELCYILLYVDDFIIASKSEEAIKNIADIIGEKFEMKCLGDIQHFLGIEIERDEQGNFMMNQRNYINKIIADCGLTDAKVSKIPLDVGYEKLECDKMLEDNNIYQKMIGQLLYVSINTRPDISASVSILSQRVSNPRQADLIEIKRIMRYLKGTSNLKLRLSSNDKEQNLIGYTDANWAESKLDRKSNSGYIFMMYGGTVSWACRKQVCVSLSSTEAEYIALCEGSQELVWIKGICKELQVQMQKSTKLYVDNQSCMKLVDNQKFSNRTKHIDTKFHFVRDLNERGELTLEYCSSELNVADLLTKPLGPKRIKDLREKAKVMN